MTEKIVLTKEESRKGATLEIDDFTDYNGENKERWIRVIDEKGRVFSGYVNEELEITGDEL